jgi:hypothetical protein
MKIYIYETPKSKIKGYLKIGETGEFNLERHNNVNIRIKEQFESASFFDEEDTKYNLLFDKELRFKSSNDLIHDTYIHEVLEKMEKRKLMQEKNGLILNLILFYQLLKI